MHNKQILRINIYISKFCNDVSYLLQMGKPFPLTTYSFLHQVPLQRHRFGVPRVTPFRQSAMLARVTFAQDYGKYTFLYLARS